MLGSRNHIDSHEAVRAMLASTRSNRDPMPFERHCRPHQSLVGSSPELLDLEAEAGVRRSRARSRLRTSLRDRHQQRVIVERHLVSRFVNLSRSRDLSRHHLIGGITIGLRIKIIDPLAMVININKTNRSTIDG